jgi:hypothetical protein
MLGGFLSIIQEHMLLLENVQNTYQSIPWYSAMYNTTGLKHSETDVVEEVFVDQLGLRQKFREAFTGNRSSG